MSAADDRPKSAAAGGGKGEEFDMGVQSYGDCVARCVAVGMDVMTEPGSVFRTVGLKTVQSGGKFILLTYVDGIASIHSEHTWLKVRGTDHQYTETKEEKARMITDKGSYDEAWCEDGECGWRATDRSSAQGAADAHACETGHTVYGQGVSPWVASPRKGA